MQVSRLVDSLERLHYGSWFKDVSGSLYDQDPWAAYTAALNSAYKTRGRLRHVAGLFLCREAVNKSDLVVALGEPTVSWLLDRNVLHAAPSGLKSRLCLLSCFGLHLFIEWPTLTPSGRRIASATYLSSGSYDCARHVAKLRPAGNAIDLGSGSGLLVLLLAATAQETTGIELDQSAVNLAKLNVTINNAEALIKRDNFMRIPSSYERFDFVVANPPWRIVPPSVTYPNPLARVGPGTDGLDRVVGILGQLPRLLAPNGLALLRFDIPLGTPRGNFLCDRPETLLGPGFHCEVTTIRKVSIGDQAAISADTCAHMDQQIPNLVDAFVHHYEQLGVVELAQVLCIIRSGP